MVFNLILLSARHPSGLFSDCNFQWCPRRTMSCFMA